VTHESGGILNHIGRTRSPAGKYPGNIVAIVLGMMGGRPMIGIKAGAAAGTTKVEIPRAGRRFGNLGEVGIEAKEGAAADDLAPFGGSCQSNVISPWML